MDVSLLSVVCCQVEVSAMGWSLIQRSPSECGVSKAGITLVTLLASHQLVSEQEVK